MVLDLGMGTELDLGTFVELGLGPELGMGSLMGLESKLGLGTRLGTELELGARMGWRLEPSLLCRLSSRIAPSRGSQTRMEQQPSWGQLQRRISSCRPSRPCSLQRQCHRRKRPQPTVCRQPPWIQ